MEQTAQLFNYTENFMSPFSPVQDPFLDDVGSFDNYNEANIPLQDYNDFQAQSLFIIDGHLSPSLSDTHHDDHLNTFLPDDHYDELESVNNDNFEKPMNEIFPYEPNYEIIVNNETTASENNFNPKANNDVPENSISIPCQTRTANVFNINNDNNYNNDNKLPQPPFLKRKRKRKIDLNQDEANFKYSYYKKFTNKKKFSKKYVIQIHKFMEPHLKLLKISREETRQIDLYFQHYSKQQDVIFDFIEKHRSEIEKFFN